MWTAVRIVRNEKEGAAQQQLIIPAGGVAFKVCFLHFLYLKNFTRKKYISGNGQNQVCTHTQCDQSWSEFACYKFNPFSI